MVLASLVACLPIAPPAAQPSSSRDLVDGYPPGVVVEDVWVVASENFSARGAESFGSETNQVNS